MNITEAIQSAFHSYQTGNLRQAEHFCTAILREQPCNETILYLLGIVHARREEYDLAVKTLERLLELNPKHADAYLALGGIFQQKGLSDESVRLYQKAIEIDPHLGEAYENLGDIFRDRHQPDEAIRHYKKALQYNPDAVEIYVNLGNIFKEKGAHDLAVFYYRSALRYKSDYAEAYHHLGMLYHEQARLEEAIAYYQKALKSNPDLPDTRIHLAHALREQNLYHKALFNYRNSLAVRIKLQFFQIEMLINAVINQLYFRTMNVQFHPGILHGESLSSGLKRRILEKIVSDIKEIGDVTGFFRDLDRLDAIRQYFETPASEALSATRVSGIPAVHDEKNRAAACDRLHREFLSLAAKIEAQLVTVLNL